MNSYIVIPARLQSTRLPEKLLLRETGKSVLQHTFEAAQQAKHPDAVWVATDSLKIVQDCQTFGAPVEMTDPNASSGTDRVAELARRLPPAEIIVNVQGDEPEISPDAIDLAVESLQRDPTAVMSTLATPIRTEAQLKDPSCVKVVFDEHGRALYFSRSPIPHARQWTPDLLEASPAYFYQHIGLYAYRRDFLLRLAALPPSPLEQLEGLEQLRVLASGQSITVGVVNEPSIGIDTEADYRAFVERYRHLTMSGRRAS